MKYKITVFLFYSFQVLRISGYSESDEVKLYFGGQQAL